jgi:hypothetical protein
MRLNMVRAPFESPPAQTARQRHAWTIVADVPARCRNIQLQRIALWRRHVTFVGC